MKALKLIAGLATAYVLVVALFELSLGYLQPANAHTLVITTVNERGVPHDRVLQRLESNGALYVAANHWPRAWYRRALAEPDVKVDVGDGKQPYRAVPVDAAEHTRVERTHGLSLGFRILTGFPPRYLLRLDPRRQESTGGSQ